MINLVFRHEQLECGLNLNSSASLRPEESTVDWYGNRRTGRSEMCTLNPPLQTPEASHAPSQLTSAVRLAALYDCPRQVLRHTDDRKRVPVEGSCGLRIKLFPSSLFPSDEQAACSLSFLVLLFLFLSIPIPMICTHKPTLTPTAASRCSSNNTGDTLDTRIPGWPALLLLPAPSLLLLPLAIVCLRLGRRG